MAKKKNTNNNFNGLLQNSDVVDALENSVKQIKKEINRKKHISVLISEEDFDYVSEVCFKRKISKNEFYKELLDDYRRQH